MGGVLGKDDEREIMRGCTEYTGIHERVGGMENDATVHAVGPIPSASYRVMGERRMNTMIKQTAWPVVYTIIPHAL